MNTLKKKGIKTFDDEYKKGRGYIESDWTQHVKEVEEKDFLLKFLAYILKNVGNPCYYLDLSTFVWDDTEKKSDAIQQTKKRILEITDGILENYIISGKGRFVGTDSTDEKVYDEEVYHIRNEDASGKRLSYCLIIRKKDLKR